MSQIQHILTVITEIESRFDVNSLKAGDLHVWPFIRMNLLLNILRDNTSWSPQLIHRYPDVFRIIHRVNNLYQLKLKPGTSKIHRSIIEASDTKLAESSNVDFMFFSVDTDHVQKLEDQHYNPYIDPYIDLIEQDYTFLKVELALNDKEIRTPRKYSAHQIRHESYKLLFAMPDIPPIQGLDALCELVFELTGNRYLYAMEIHGQILNLIRLSALFEHVLNIVKPRVVMMRTYYYLPAIALVYACHKTRTTCVDIQHGFGQHHPAYSQWTTVPKQGYALLPDIFWTWGKISHDYIHSWIERSGTQKHQSVIGGHRWLGQCQELEDSLAHLLSDELYADVQRGKKIILITMQKLDWDDALPQHLLDTMRESPDDWLWLIRLHPLYKDAQDLNRLKNLLAREVGGNYYIDEALSTPLFVHLSISHFHLTRYSNSVYEAVALGVPTIIFHPDGRGYFEDFIASGVIRLGLTSTELTDILTHTEPANPNPHYAEISRDVAQTAMNTIYQMASQK